MSTRRYSDIASAISHGAKRARKFIRGAQAARAAVRAVKSEIGSVLTGPGREGPSSAITGQHDSKMLYKRRRAPRKVRRRARRRARVFLKNQLSNKSSNTNLFEHYKIGYSDLDSQGIATITSGYTWSGAGTVNSDNIGSIYQVIQNIENADPTDIAKDWYLTGMSTDYTVANTSEVTMELDVYEFVYRKELTYESNVLTTAQFINEKNDEESKLPGATNKLVVTNLGWVPTDANVAMRYILIKSKQRFYLGAGNAVSFTKRTRYRKPVKYNGSDFEMSQNAANGDIFIARPGVTRGIIMVGRGLPNTSGAATATTFAWNAQTRYTVKQVDREDDKHATGV